MRDKLRAADSARIATRVSAAIVTGLAFWLYYSTMLPGVDLGDTPSFQTMGGSWLVSARDAYPLYFALAAPFVWWFPNDLARAMNLASVVEAALACGLVVLVATELSGSVSAALVAAVLFGSSYTFWSQAVTTEVYALHMICVALVLLALWTWQREPTLKRLACFFLVYAFGFGNHLSMVVLLPGLVAFLFLAAPGGTRAMIQPRVIAVASACALAGALPYLWTIRTMVNEPVPPQGAIEAARWFWFEVTKADWRESMMLQVPRVMVSERLAMFLFDVRQQFGVLPLLAAAAGAVTLARVAPLRLCLLLLWMLSTAVFALTYSVGDTHVFLLPLHFVVALLVAPGLVAGSLGVSRLFGGNGAPLLLLVALLFAAGRTYTEYPALDRSGDRRAEQALEDLTAGVHDSRSVLLSDLNWQLQNGLNYYAEHEHREVAFARMPDVLLYAPVLIRDNRAIGRDTVLTDLARAELRAAYGPLFAVTPANVPVELPVRIAQTPRGQRYVVCWLKPTPEVSFDLTQVNRSIDYLTGGRLTSVPAGDFVAVAGLAGEAPELIQSSNVPFRRNIVLGELSLTVRMEAWFPFDTIRRMGFGHVIAGRHHSLIVERGLSFVALDAEGRATQTEYAAGLFEPQPTFRVDIQ